MKPTEQQLRAIESDAKQILCVAGPGSGKTFTVIQRILRLIRQGVEPDSICVIVYTNEAARVIHDRLHPATGEFAINLGFLGTLHSFCLRHLQEFAGMKNITVLDQDEADEELLRCAKAAGVKASPKELTERRKWWGVRQYDERKDAVHIAVASYYRKMEANRALDFNAILTRAFEHLSNPTTGGVATRKPFDNAAVLTDAEPLSTEKSYQLVYQRGWKHLLVDEFQDASRADFETYMAIAADNRFFVGDPDQCQPAGTLIRMADDTRKPIEDVIEGDKVLTYDRHDKRVYRTGIVTATGRRDFRGKLYTVRAGDHYTDCTGNHKWLIRWPSGKDRTLDNYCTYIMRKGDHFRVGKTKFFRSSGQADFGIIGAGLRLNQERADDIWVLKLHATNVEAMAYEQIVAATYGLPGVCFLCGSRHALTQEAIYEIFSKIPDQRRKAEQCLFDHDRDIEFPLIRRSDAKTRRTVQEVHACNLLSDVMSVPVVTGVSSGPYTKSRVLSEWKTLKVSVESEWSGDVYSLETSPDHRYVANEIVTGNSIFGWRGGDITGIMRCAESADWETILLEGNFRSGAAICEAAQRLIENDRERVRKATISLTDKESTVGSASFETDVQEAATIATTIQLKKHVVPEAGINLELNEIAVLARTNAIVENIATTLEAHGIPVRRRMTIKAPEDWKTARAALRMLAARNDDSIIRFIRLTNAAAAATAEHQAALGKINLRSQFMAGLECRLDSVGRDLTRLRISRESVERIEKLRDELPEPTMGDLVLSSVQDFDYEEQGEGVTVTTIHGAKGREWDTVILAGFEEETIPGVRFLNIEEERRVAYVGMTRARTTLRITWVKARRENWGRRDYRETKPSRFISEAGV